MAIAVSAHKKRRDTLLFIDMFSSLVNVGQGLGESATPIGRQALAMTLPVPDILTPFD